MWWDSILAYLQGIDFVTLVIVFLGAFIVAHSFMQFRSYLVSRKSPEYFAAQQVRQKEKIARKEKTLQAVYNITCRVPLLKEYLKKIEKSYLGICPYEASYLMKIASESIALTFFVCIMAILLILSFNLAQEKYISLYSITCCFLAVYVSGIECANNRLKKRKKVMFKDMIRYFSATKHAYTACGSIPVAISQAAEGLGHEINRQALVLHNILSGTERKEKVREYVLAPTTNKYMKLFAEQAYEVSENGDSLTGDSESLFAKNLEFLRVEIKRDMYQEEKRLFKLEGYTFVCLFPIFFMTCMKNCGISFSEELTGFYDGPGQFIMLISFLVTVAVYDAINRAKEVVFRRGGDKESGFDKVPAHSPIRKIMERIELGRGAKVEEIRKMLRDTGSLQTFGSFVMTMAAYIIVVTILGTIFFANLHAQNKEQLLTEVNNIDSVVSLATEQAKANIKTHILAMTNDYLYEDDISLETLEADFHSRMYMPNKEIRKNVALEVQTRILSCRNEYLKWYEFYIALIMGLGAAVIPYVGLKYRYNLILQGRDDEIRQFQAIILMERLFPSITCIQMLEEMESFARVFKPSLQKCINSYAGGPLKALQTLRDDEIDSEEFVELVDGFIAVERVGVAVAFAEVASNREMTQVIKELEEEKDMERKRDMTDTLSMFPAFLAFGVYFVLPFSLNVFSRLFVMFDMLESF